ncbi:O-methyltransferase [Methylovulum psychrotolerans]|uniref:Uncharacterized protein n=1 Tax=Methylovulum psychrotolerans TaxID=1704499 RepID=A0A2S5CQC4_9GAMM|nr:O-methyltransferase [Methylovulum psychrotolerans]POZ52995.1 hypothetical protein AADEFJLK_00004 [Methylovulum psychrotolerans]
MLDYAAAKDRQKQLQEVETIASKLAANDILKITLNSSVKTLGNRDEFESIDEFQQKALTKAQNKLGRYFPNNVTDYKSMTDRGFTDIISQAAKKAILRGLRGSPNLVFLPLGQFRYNDGFHWMYTITGIVLKSGEENEFLEKSGLNRFELVKNDWDNISDIALPDLSLRERMCLDLDIHSLDPCEIHKKLPFKFDSDEERSLDCLKRYITHYKRYPNFVKAVF